MNKVLKGSNTTRSFMTTSTSHIAKAFDTVIGRTATRLNLVVPLKEEEVRPHPFKNPIYHELINYASPSKELT